MQAVLDAIERIPVATITHVFVALILGVDLIVQGSLSSDALTYAGIVEGGNVGVAGARAHVAGKKVDAAATPAPSPTWGAIQNLANTTSGPDFALTPVGDAPDEPGDPDGLSHISTTTDQIPTDKGDAGEAGR
jgi:hypothetical protein